MFIDKYLKVEVFTVWDKTAKSVPLEIFRLYGIPRIIILRKKTNKTIEIDWCLLSNYRESSYISTLMVK